ncbi:RagB/SusD family nutrient uptake outer membrane protein [Ferruginibacter albus]|uniref:RagB/SusD family nutrient uptake outer membrane protein n=1 Tax=Ferruginibacter albus TaxID=2875540 RepID=UPI001CC79689|nr:RagB/SusD family nutrient uptake outer membrane protein [Ferruginibacter albus]UAY53652.1 RagB/SusD family nutrient uptake outer membrane protein [Ferruginibacter albus]
MINKKILKLVLPGVIIFGVLLSSCQKYLQEDPDSSLTVDQTFSNVDSAYRALLGVYNKLTGDQGYGIRLNIYYTMGTDESMLSSSNTTDNGRRDISRYNLTSSNSELTKPFNQLYAGIEQANNFIDNAPHMPAFNGSQGADNQAKAKRMYGEALTLRAQFYLDLIKIWGDVPAPMIPASKNPVSFPQKEDRDVVYDELLNDLKTAEDNLPWKGDAGVANDERITKASAMGLRARIALFRAGFSLRRNRQMQQGSNPQAYYTIARDECKAIMESGKHSLDPSFKDLFKTYLCGVQTPVDPYGEIIFQVAMAGGSGIADSKMGYADGPRVNGSGNSFVLILPTAFYAFDSTDLRRDVCVAPYDVAADGITKVPPSSIFTTLRDGKFRRDWVTPAISPTDASQYFGINWPLIRYSDVLLMYAEAQNALNSGPTADAVEAVNMVRRRAYGKDITTADATVDISPVDQQGFFKAIVDERFKEFMGEGLRKYDLIRWNLLSTKIQETITNLNLMNNQQPPYQNLPQFMYYYTAGPTITADDGTLWANSFYNPSPSGTNSIANAKRVNWIGTSTSGGTPPIAASLTPYFASSFVPNHSELFPIYTTDIINSKLPQDYGY